MTFSREELEWLDIAIQDNNNYKICVDNDLIAIYKCLNDEGSDWDKVFEFNNFGENFIVQLLNYVGCLANKA